MRVLIVGAGIAGLAAARALRQVGIDCEIVERAATWDSQAAGIYLPGNGMAALGRLGLAGVVASAGQLVSRRRVLDDRGRSIIDFDEAGLWADVASPIALHRRDLQRALVEGAAGVPINRGMTVTHIDESAESVHVGLTDGSSRDIDLLIGADGIHSSIRQQFFGGPGARLAGQVGWRFVVDGHSGIDGWNGWLGRDRGFLALGIGRDRVYCVGDIRSTDGTDPTGADLDAFRALFAGYPAPVPDLLAGIRVAADLWFSPFEEVAPPTWTAGRIVLIGDAAHASAPNMAEGASMAIEDALVLADSLSTGDDLATSLAGFVQRRAARVEHVQRMTRRRDRLRFLHPVLRRTVMGVAGHEIFHAHYRPLLTPP